jgi:predicted O-linked N-acetylglucosamine transferase (SPINDLY family)
MLANNPQQTSCIKKKLLNNRFTTPLFDTCSYVRGLERAFIKMYERYHANLQLCYLKID